MSKKQVNSEEIVRLASEDFESTFEYTNPFAALEGLNPASVPVADLDDLVEESLPVESQTKPEDPAGEHNADEDDDSDSSDLSDEDSEAEASPEKEANPKLSTVPASLSASTKTGKESSTSGAGKGTTGGSSGGSNDKPTSVLSGKTSQQQAADKGDGSSPGQGSSSGKGGSSHSRKSSNMSPFSNTKPRSVSLASASERPVASGRAGGVTSPPPSDAASIAGMREDQEEDLDHGLQDAESLIDTLTAGPKSRPVPSKRRSSSGTKRVFGGSPSKSQPRPVIASAKSVVGDPVAVSGHEIRIAALEKIASDLLLRNNELADKTDALVKEVVSVRSELLQVEARLIIEINEKSKRVGGPAPAVTVTAPSPVVPQASSPLPANVVSSSRPASTQPVTVGPNGLTGEALRRYLLRKRQQ